MPDAAGTPRVSRQHASGAGSARGLLFTVLGEFVLPGGGTAWTSALIDTLGRLGVEEKATRQALMRTASDGWLTAERVGRQTRWRLTPSAESLLTEGTERIFGFGTGQQEWDGRWLVVLAPVQDGDRRTRHYLRTRLTWAGLGSVAPGTWLSTHPERAAEVEDVLRAADLLDRALLFTGEYAGGRPAEVTVRQAWDMAAIGASYESFLATFRDTSAPDPLARVIELVHAWRRFPAVDPGLPTALLPTDWPGVAAARRFAARHQAWIEPARHEWDGLNP